jgi:hypothetical protein
MTDTKLSRREGLRGLLALGAAGAAAAVAGSTLLAVPAQAAQPHMDAALVTLRTALHQLDVALDDKGGFRVKAIGLVTDAIRAVEDGIAYAKSH